MKNVVFSIKKKPFIKMLFYGQICSLSLTVKIGPQTHMPVILKLRRFFDSKV